MTPDQAARILAAFEKADDYRSLMWRVTIRPYYVTDVKLFAECSDLFHCATADAEEIDAEEITADDIPLLEATLADLKEAGEEFYLAELFAARKRKLRPLLLTLQGIGQATRALFEAAGSEEGRIEADRQDAAFWAHVGQKIRDEPGGAKSAATGETA